MVSTTKSKGRKNNDDKFYTKDSTVDFCLERINVKDFTHVIEPSAGSGAFSLKIPQSVSYDINPEHDSIIQQNWLTYVHVKQENEKVLVIGNPPFGQQNHLAIKFINHAAGFADTVAFILPPSFKKQSIKNKINPYFHVTDEYELPKDSFLLNGESYSLPTIFQIWSKQEFARIPDQALESKRITFVKKSEQPDFCIQRIGGNAGKAFLNWQKRSESSNYFVKVIDNSSVLALIDVINSTVFLEREWSVGPRSLSKQELVRYIG